MSDQNPRPDYMSLEDAARIVGRLSALWPRPEISEATIAEYLRFIRKYDYLEAMHAIDQLAEECDFLPSIAKLADSIDLPLGPPKRMTLDDLYWSGHNPLDFPEWMRPEGWEQYARPQTLTVPARRAAEAQRPTDGPEEPNEDTETI